ncbi:MAG: toxic anion resistance protein, partial [Paracoccus sp. (in: a-proteobacteria)]|nr:toxic anion resistance protein [Paracoccus sp. (in: a-proteobacteria)]
MTTETQRAATTSQAEIEAATAIVLPEPQAEIVPLEAAPAPLADEIRRRMDEIDLRNSGSIVHFGTRAQAGLQEISQKMLADVKNKDVGPAGDSLRNIVTTIRGFSVSELDVRRERSWWEKLLGRTAPFARFVASYEQVQGQIDKISEDLMGHEHQLL